MLSLMCFVDISDEFVRIDEATGSHEVFWKQRYQYLLQVVPKRWNVMQQLEQLQQLAHELAKVMSQ